MKSKVSRLYDYQNDIRQRLSEAWRRYRSIMIQMPTGTGKTVVLASLVSEEPETVIIVAHRRELVAQIEETVERFGISTADGRVMVMSIQWLSKHLDDVGLEPHLVIIDEAHHAVAETYRTLWDRFPRARFLGLTATPCRMSRMGFTDLFDTLITSWSIAEFIEKGYLSAFDYVSLRHGSEEQRLIDSLGKRGADGDYQIKEMDGVLNRSTSIVRLYTSMERFAHGRKGIVYAISIAHARRIADYYVSRGVNAVPIDSRTPSAERRRLVDGFKSGGIQVLVNVDIFSEGFDCPDVEFVQLARPTLSLAKYLQQVGRGLRRTSGKKACVLIDNVGLYRMFGLPTASWDWDAMFRGVVSGRGCLSAGGGRSDAVLSERLREELVSDCDMELIIAHGQLLAEIGRMKDVRPVHAETDGLRSWQDIDSGLWGLSCGRRQVTEAQYVTVFDIKYGMAAVRFRNMSCGIVNDAGEVVWQKDDCHSVKFLRDCLLHILNNKGGYLNNKDGHKNKDSYLDLYSMRVYGQKPRVHRFGNVELLEIDRTYYSRTKKVYVNNQGIDRQLIDWRGFYLAIYDLKVPYSRFHRDSMPSECHSGFACILEGDIGGYYWMYRRLADGSIIIMDDDGKYYHAVDGKPKRYIGCSDSKEDWERCRTEINLLTRMIKEKWSVLEAERTERRRRQLADSNEAVPFRSGVRWGLRVGSRVTIPPIYRKIKSPVGKYCAVEKNYSQWGVVALDGTVMVEPKYSEIDISIQGVVTGTKVTGSKERMKLP